MDRTCYFCEKLSPYDCKKHLDVSYLPNQYEYEARKCDTFTPNADWLEYERYLDEAHKMRNKVYQQIRNIQQLQKENEELKKVVAFYEGKEIELIPLKDCTGTIKSSTYKFDALVTNNKSISQIGMIPIEKKVVKP
jgi:hypothetical protein